MPTDTNKRPGLEVRQRLQPLTCAHYPDSHRWFSYRDIRGSRPTYTGGPEAPGCLRTARALCDTRWYDAPLPACVRAGPLSLAGVSDLASTASIVALPHFLSHDRAHTVVTGGIAES